MREIPSILICVVTASLGQVLLKAGMTKTPIGSSAITLELIISLLKNEYLISGLFLYILSFIIWLYILSYVKLSYAYPIISLSYPIIIILSYFVLKEPIGIMIIIGITLICMGVVVIGISH
jgi:multidrug transporter EmrE-like cation transporter